MRPQLLNALVDEQLVDEQGPTNPSAHRTQRSGCLRCMTDRGGATLTPIPGPFDEFVGAELPRLLALARVLTGNDHDAWDLTQEALARVGARWNHVDHDRNPAAYARKALVRLNLNRLRRVRREVLVWAAPEHSVSPSDLGEADELQEALAMLPRRQRTALVLRYYADLTIAEIADVMECAEGTVKSQISRGLAILRERMPADSRS